MRESAKRAPDRHGVQLRGWRAGLPAMRLFRDASRGRLRRLGHPRRRARGIRETTMADAYIYDHVRTPRGRGKPDGALHEVSALELADDRAARAQGAQRSRYEARRRRGARLRRSGRRSRRRHRPHGRAPAGYGNRVPGVQINRFCASGLDAVNFAAAQVMAGQHDMAVGGGVEIDEPRRHGRVGRRLAGRSRDRDSSPISCRRASRPTSSRRNTAFRATTSTPTRSKARSAPPRPGTRAVSPSRSCR